MEWLGSTCLKNRWMPLKTVCCSPFWAKVRWPSKTAETHWKRAGNRAGKNEELRANLLRTISHDLRTPLTSISGNASNLLSNGETLDTETRNKICTDIFDDAQWLIGLVENLLSITRIEDGRMNLQISPQLMDEMIEEALHHVNRKSCEHTITTQYGDEILLVNVDARLIMQVVVNLVDNAIKYTLWARSFRFRLTGKTIRS